jgi:hypothetical protein
LDITGATRTPTAAMEVPLGLPSGHAYLIQDMKKEPILQMETDKMILRHVYDKPFTIRFPDRSKWKEGFQPNRNGGLIRLTEGSNTNKGTRARVNCHGTRRKLSFSFGQKCMPLQHVQSRI